MSMAGAGGANGGLGGMVVPGVIVAVVVGAFLWLSIQAEETALRESATGFDGLAEWLDDQGAEVEIKTAAWPAPADAYGLRIMPIYDTSPEKRRNRPASEEELLQQLDERDEDYTSVYDKQKFIPTIYVLPKWRTGMRMSRRAHVDFTGDLDRLNKWTTLPQGFPGTLISDAEGFADYPVPGSNLRARLYAPQVFSGGDCRPLVGSGDAMILAECETHSWPGDGPERVWMLSDPDLLNNHGLSLGDNAAIAALLLPEIAGDRRIVVDYTLAAWSDAVNEEYPERSWADLLRFFTYPFSLLWIGFAAFMMLAIWRSWARYGAPERLFDDEMSAAKDVAVTAKARLLRISGHDGALVAEHVAQRLHELAATVFGPHRKQTRDPLPDLATWLVRRDNGLADRFEAATEAARGLAPTASTQDALQALDEFETCYERVLDDFGGTQGRG